VAALVVWAFLPSLSNGFVTYDDPDYVTKNANVQGGFSLAGIAWAFDPTTRVSANWHPLTLVSHMLDCDWYGLNPFGHHLTALVLHAANSVLLFVLLQRMTGALGCSLAVAAWFGLHPAHVESVAWVAERKDVLSGLFWMLTLLAYAEFAKNQEASSPRARTWYVLALVSFLFGLLTKPMLVTLPCMLFLLDYWPLRRLTRTSFPRLLLEKLPFFVLTLSSSVITFIIQKKAGAMDMVEAVPFVSRLTNSLVSYCRYIGMLIWPVNLTVFYPLQVSWPLTTVVLSVLLIAVVLLAAVLLGRRCPYLPVGWFWFLGTLVPVIGLVQVGAQSIADRYTYLPSIGLFIVVAWAADDVRRRWRVPAWAVGAIGSATVLSCVAATRYQIGFWKDGETLFRRAVAFSGDHYLPRLSLGAALLEKRSYREAIVELERARELRPTVVLTHLNLGAALLADERTEEAIAACREATRLDPKLLTAWNNLGRCQLRAGKASDAVESFRKALTIAPDDADVHHLLGVALRTEHRFDEAVLSQRRSLELRPGMALAREELIKALILKGQLDEARLEWRSISGLVPDSVVEHNSFGVLLAEIGQIDAATKEFEAAQRIAPDDPATKNNLARAYEAKTKQGKPANAGSIPPR
jgi:Flp pilus assembly protein TadD